MRNGSARPSRGLTLVLTVAAAILVNCAGSGSASTAQPTAQPAPASAYQVTPQTTLEDLVAPIALYPDDLLAILLPASAYPLDVVQASRFLDRLEKNTSLQPNPAWDESVRNLLNTPDVVELMAGNLDWTIRLGEEVATDQGAVMEAIHRHRRAGNDPRRDGGPPGDLRPAVQPADRRGALARTGGDLLPHPLSCVLLPLSARLQLRDGILLRSGHGLRVRLGCPRDLPRHR
jgi:hypothetical protein